MTCLPSGSWNSAIPFCESVLCPDITNSSEKILRTSVVSREVGGKAIFSCPPGYIIRGSSGESVCQPNGEWTKPTPHCEGDRPLFAVLSELTNFAISLTAFAGFRSTVLGYVDSEPFKLFQRWFVNLQPVRKTATSKEEVHTKPVKWSSSTVTADS